MASTVPRLLELETALRYGWDLDAYGPRTGAKEEDGGGGDYAIDLELVDKSIGSSFFWGMLLAISEIAEWLSEFMARIDSCLCHCDLLYAHRHDQSQQMTKLRKIWDSCPMRGMMAPWFATGQAFVLLSSLGEAWTAACQLRLPAALSDADRQEVLND